MPGLLTSPQRIQLFRKKGLSMPPGSRSVARPGRFGNPYRVVHDRSGWWCMLPGASGNGYLFRTELGARAQATHCFREMLDVSPALVAIGIGELRGLNLGCYCDLPAPGEPDHCHAAVWIERVNRPELVCEAAHG